ncbi:TRAP transporter small permease [Lysinibacillus sp. 2017]|uniref:TRAP transporter small permease n=1 Tax=unclassified Lysinibacillus TaxID=2636778 RepID=UPI000D527A46|nr:MULTISPECIES: TRAP transporter small permease [unclassified Lysinibacillus]AWE07247.1 TRAP transporter small permease [Lysinibacillus sp. 2017]TGN33304.1 TRAP transporter small permease [Lysinibacillus sp. S2017]
MVKQAAGIYIKFENFLTNFLLVAIVFFVFLAAIMRWAGLPLSWSVEFAQLLFVWVIFLGSNRTLRERKHITVDIFVKVLPLKVRRIIEVLTKILVIAFLVFLTIYGFQLSVENSARQISNLPLSYSFITLAVPIGSVLMICTILAQLKEELSSIKSSNELKS